MKDAEQSIARVQRVYKQALDNNARLKKSLEAAQLVVDRNVKEGGPALAAYKLRHAELTMGVQLGEGSFGTVYHGTFRGSDCAVKTVRATKVTDKMVREFIGEITLMAPLRHPNLVGLIGGCWTDGPDKLCIVLEYCSKGSLGGMVKNRSNTWESHYYDIALGVARCFKYLHHEQPSEPLIHRDLKPDNVLIAGDGAAKVADFGESTRFEDTLASAEDNDGNLTMTMVGTPMYCVRVLNAR
jgi:serine/threonine protein kinase